MKYFEKVKLVRDEYERLTGVKPPYDKSTKNLSELISLKMAKKIRLDRDSNPRPLV